MRSTTFVATFLCTLAPVATAHADLNIQVPDDFPRFAVPGHEKEMDTLRKLFYLHYQPPAGPLATLWDEWMSGPTLWPACNSNGRMDELTRRWATALTNRHMDPEGYVATHQHPSIAHQQGWPFPFWAQGKTGTWGWHFSLQNVMRGWHGTHEKTQAGWQLDGAWDWGIYDHAWNLQLDDAKASVTTPRTDIDPMQAPFIQLRWRANGLQNAQPYLEWITDHDPVFNPERRMYFEPAPNNERVTCTMIPVYRSPQWTGRIIGLRVSFDNPPDAWVGIQSLFTQYDTRHNINNPCFIRGCCQYFLWTRDLGFLRNNLQRIRLAMHYLMEDLGGRREKCIVAPWVGHDGRSGIHRDSNGQKTIRPGRGIGNNYWDLLPMGYKDAYATIHYYDTLKDLADLEREITTHPEWNLPTGPLRLDPDDLLQHAAEIKTIAGQMFWNDKNGRFICGLDTDGKSYDYGYTFINCEAIYYDFATNAQANTIMEWLTGRRTVEGDTSQGKDIYRWRFAPRASTKRNIDWYGWYWSNPESIAFGDQVQDGGAVLGFSYHDLMSRLRILGPDDAWHRLREIIQWFDEIQAAGGYREYYKDGTRGTLQGGGTPGGLGCDKEFYESILVPQIVLDGFLGFKPRGDGFEINPRLPSDWSQLAVTRIRLHRLVLDIQVEGRKITIQADGHCPWPMRVYSPPGDWQIITTGGNLQIAG